MTGFAGFIEKTCPQNVLDVIEKDVLNRLLNSYCFPLVTGLTVYYPRILPATMESLALVEPAEVQELFFSSICRQYRCTSKACDQKCAECVKGTVLKYYEGTFHGPKLHQCHLGIWEMIYPLYARGLLLGVLIGGQMIVGEEISDWGKVLAGVKDEVEWCQLDSRMGNQIPHYSHQVEQIRAAIDADNKLELNQKEGLKSAVMEGTSHSKFDVAGLLKRYEKFKEFGRTLERVAEDLYTAQIEAARRKHIHLTSQELTQMGEKLTEEPEQFWLRLDRVVRGTLPHVKGYVLYKLDPYCEGFEPVRTCIFDRGVVSGGVGFRKFCRQVFDELCKGTGHKRFVLYDILNRGTPSKFRDLFRYSIHDWNQVSGGAYVAGIPLIEGSGRITGGLVSLCVSDGERVWRGEGDFWDMFLGFYVEALHDIACVLTMVLARHRLEEAQASAWAVRSHELVAPIHAVKGYQDNLTYLVRKHVAPLLSEDAPIKGMFGAQLFRLGKLCDLLELVATSGSVEGEAHFMKVHIESKILLPIVQPLREYGQSDKRTSVRYDKAISEIPGLYLFVDGMKRCLFNLVFNAIKYADKRSRVHVALKLTRDNYEIHVINSGIGIPKGEEELIFQRFTQGSNVSTIAAYGAGLGLHVARQMARIHAGDVRLLCGDPKSTVFALVLPRFLESDPPDK